MTRQEAQQAVSLLMGLVRTVEYCNHLIQNNPTTSCHDILQTHYSTDISKYLNLKYFEMSHHTRLISLGFG